MSYQQQQQRQFQSPMSISMASTQQQVNTTVQASSMQKPLQFQQQRSDTLPSWEHTQYQNTSGQESIPQFQQQQPTQYPNVQYPKLSVQSTHSTDVISQQQQQQMVTESQVITGDTVITQDPNSSWQQEQDSSIQLPNNTSDQKRKFFRRPILRKRRDPFRAKIFRKTVKKRRNAYLKRVLAPKSALSILHELHPNLKMTLSEERIGNQLQYSSKIEIDGKEYDGSGLSEASAKEIGSENALKVILLEKLEQLDKKSTSDSPKPPEQDDDTKMDDTDSTEAAGEDNTSAIEVEADVDEAANITVEAGDTAETPVTVPNSPVLQDVDDSNIGNKNDNYVKELKEDNASWSIMASYAIFKLFAEWQSQGLNEPVFSEMTIRTKLGNITKTVKSDSGAIPRKHPVQLLHEIRPDCQFIEKREGSIPNLVFTYSVTADGQTFTGTGRNKKLAKKECAKNALDALGVKYICL